MTTIRNLTRKYAESRRYALLDKGCYQVSEVIREEIGYALSFQKVARL